MPRKTQRITVRQGEPLQLPREAVEGLGDVNEAILVIDPEKRTVLITAIDPEIAENKAILDELAKLNEGMSLDEYGAPVPQSFLDRRGKGDGKGDA